jgi:hypothetical protein
MKAEQQYGFCHLSVVPARAEPSDRSEMVTQLLFGETLEILELKDPWVKVRLVYDDYECWVDIKQFLPISYHTFMRCNFTMNECSADLVQVVTDLSTQETTPILFGSSLPNIQSGEFSLDDRNYKFEGTICLPFEPNKREIIEEYAYHFLGSPYLWGGRSTFGVDCSGFVQVVYKMSGIKLKRDASQQSEYGTTLSFVEEAQPGDLAFFDNEEGKIVHVGIVLKNQEIIHASGKVRIDRLDHQGIFNVDSHRYTHRLRLLKTFLD